MAMGRPKAALVLSPEQRAQLESMASSRSLPAGLGTRVRIVLLSAAGKRQKGDIENPANPNRSLVCCPGNTFT